MRVGGADLARTSTGQLFGNLQLFYQLLDADPGRMLDRIEFSTVGISDPANDADWGIFAVSGQVNVVPEPASAVTLLLGLGCLVRRRRVV